jgi:multidrug efflux pump subunit AcrB
MPKNTGIAGRIARPFIHSKLTPLLMAAFLAIGLYGAWLTPREEEPQISVPMVDLFVAYPGASPSEVESRVVEPLERLAANIDGVEYVYATAMPGQAMVSVRFLVGEDQEESLVRLYTEMMKRMDEMPPGASQPLIKTRAIDDVPMLALTLWSARYDDFELRRLAQELAGEIKKVEDVAAVDLIGGRSRQIRVVLERDRLAGYGLDPLAVARQLQAANTERASGSFVRNDTEYLVETGNFLTSAEEVANLVVGVREGRPIYLRSVATVEDGPAEPSRYVAYGLGDAYAGEADGIAAGTPRGVYPAVTLAIAKRPGTDAMRIAEDVLEKVDRLEASLLPADVQVTVTRNYGETASDKVGELLIHLLSAVLAVAFVVTLAMGWRGGLVVFLSVPITFALTLFVYYLLGYTLNRITLFALVFVTGIVVDDSIIIAENIHRHFKMRHLPFRQAVMAAIDEVGNPTILATFTVIAAVLPMAFVSGLMGPYMSPMPIGASFAMLFSLLVALVITPYLAYRLLRHDTDEDEAPKDYRLEDTRIYRLYAASIRPLLERPLWRWSFIGGVTALLLGSLLLFYFNAVVVKMLPFDNKNEIQVVIDMPEGTTLERTAVVTRELAAHLADEPEVVDFQTYVGTSAPVNFNGLVRHYDLRRGANVADIQVNLLPKDDRDLQSHAIARRIRPGLQEIAARYGARIKVAEVPPGPPVLSTLVAEVYGPDYAQQRGVARQIREVFETTAGVVDVDWTVEDEQTEYRFVIEKEKALRAGVMPQRVVETMALALDGRAVSTLSQEDEVEPVGLHLRLAREDRSSLEDLKNLQVQSRSGALVPISGLVTIEERVLEKSIQRKNQRRVVYVTGEVAGELESPIYAILNMQDRIDELALPEGYALETRYASQPFMEDDFAVKWDGEWQITYEVFRDLGAAFAVVLVIIYLLIVGWFQDFKVPLVLMVAIPLSLVGILVGHWLLGAFFTATSMIGLIALAGIMVRNSVLLIDFIELRLAEGTALKDAVIEAGAVRTTPILLTAGTVVIGAFVILFDPIFQGLAISLMGGAIVSTVLTLLIVPLLYYMMEKDRHAAPPTPEPASPANRVTDEHPTPEPAT